MYKCSPILILAVLVTVAGCGKKSEKTEFGDEAVTLKETSAQSTAHTRTSSEFAGAFAVLNEAEAKYTDFAEKEAANWDKYVSAETAGWELEISEEGGEEGDWDTFVQQQTQNWEEYKAEQERQWQNYTTAQRERWEQYVAEVEAKWGKFQGSTKTEWVEYSGDREAKSYVNFKEGAAVFEVIVNENAPNQDQLAKQKLIQIIDQALSEKDVGRQNILSGQISDPQALRTASSSPVRRSSVTGKDGVTRARYSIAATLVPNHLKLRAGRYEGLVNQYSRQYNLDPSLVMAIMETESYFNPRAKSWANAYGLMQIVPKYAGRDTWREIFGRDGIPTGDYLLKPENNVKHGCCYLNILMNKAWKKVPQGNKKDYLVICSYNCGPGNVNRMVLRDHGSPDKHSEQELFSLLTTYTPEETRDYLRKVTKKRPKWRSQ